MLLRTSTLAVRVPYTEHALSWESNSSGGMYSAKSETQNLHFALLHASILAVRSPYDEQAFW